MLHVNDTLVGKVEKMAFGGSGILKKDHFVLFVPFSAPGDEISCQITQIKKNYGKAQILKVLNSSALREKPKCRYFEKCGGCQLQHVQYQEELKQKREWIQEAFYKFSQFKEMIVPPVAPSPKEYDYRRHITLTLQKKPKEKAFAGYHTIQAKSLIKIEECPIFIKKENSLLKEIQLFIEELEITETEAKLEIVKDQGTYLLHFHFKRLPKNADLIAKNFLEKQAAIKGIILNSKTKSFSFGKTECQLLVNGLIFNFSSHAFMQNNREQSIKIYSHLLELIKEENPEEVLDLYCGIGISSLLIAREGFKVTGVEYNATAIKAAIHNAKKNGINSVKFIHATAEDAVEKIKIPEFVIVNPPREGLDVRVIEAIKKKLPKKIVYISCMPPTLARDLKLFGEAYQIESCSPFDMFPKTTHVEIILVLKLSNSPYTKGADE